MADAVTLDTFRNHANEMNDAFCDYYDSIHHLETTPGQLEEWTAYRNAALEAQELFERKRQANRSANELR